MDEVDQKDSQKDTTFCVPQRLEVVCGPTGRRRWPAREKARIVCESLRGDVAVTEVARRNGLRPNQLFLWRRQAREGALVLPGEALDGLAFAPVVVGDGPRGCGEPERNTSSSIEIEAAGVIVRVCARTPAARVGELAAALRGAR